MKKILLIGNPNIGKSAFFTRLTGVDVIISNYPGTTVEYKKGKMKINKQLTKIIDVPGIYTLEPTCKADKIATKMLKQGSLIINVVDATNLERNLYLTLQLLEKNIPVIMALNFWDEAKHKGIKIDYKKLAKILDIPIIPTIAISGQGIKELVSTFKKAKAHHYHYDKWHKIGQIIKQVQKITPRKHTLFEKLEDYSIKPLTGIPLAIVVLAISFWIVRFIGENLIDYLFNPLFDLYLPLVEKLSQVLGSGFLHNILIGITFNGQIDFIQSMGLLTTGLYVPLAMVLPYVFAFYLILGVLEDSGYLPRLATLFDNIMHKLGMHGLAIIPMLLSFGCNVPGALSTRILETKRQRFIATTLLAIAIPCMAQIAMVTGLLGQYGPKAFFIIFITLLLVWIILGLIIHKLIKGTTPETFMEISPYRFPHFKTLAKKLWMRMRGFLTEAIPFVFLGVLLVNILYILGIIDFLSIITAPIVTHILGLPKEAVASLVAGFLRKDVAIGMLLPLNLNMKQLIIASIVLTMYFPCIGTFIVLFKELGIKDLAKSTAIMIFSSLVVGGLLNLIL